MNSAGWRPGALGSLLQMLKVNTSAFLGAYGMINWMRHGLTAKNAWGSGAFGIPAPDFDRWIGYATNLENACQDLELPVTLKRVADLLKAAKEMLQHDRRMYGNPPSDFVVFNPKTEAELQRHLMLIGTCLEDELSARTVLMLENTRAHYYGELVPFGQDVSDRFPAAIDDIEGAARCLALEQGTATVMHLMRVIEVGLRALASALKIPYAPSWESYLKQIQDRIAAPRKRKTAAWRKAEPFYRDVSGDLLTIKQAFRNPTMHVVRKFSPDEAQEIFNASKNFMQRLATGLPAPKRKS